MKMMELTDGRVIQRAIEFGRLHAGGLQGAALKQQRHAYLQQNIQGQIAFMSEEK